MTANPDNERRRTQVSLIGASEGDEELLAKARAEVRFNWGPLITSTSGLDALPLAE